ncbi:hypothetical protein AALO_G00310680, partial [Alosa alosa]
MYCMSASHRTTLDQDHQIKTLFYRNNYLSTGCYLSLHLNLPVNIIYFTESQNLSSVTKVCVQSGKSVTIPFLYDQKYKGYKKICQRGIGTVNHPDWEAEVHNGNNKSSKTMSMSDDVTNSIFTLTVMMDVGVQYTNVNVKKYSCAVAGGGPTNEKAFTLLDTDDIPELRVQNQTVFGYEGGTVVVDCLHKNLTGEKKWCRIDGSCLKVGEGNGMLVETADAAGVFKVTLRNLQEKNSGWYWCSVGESQMPVHITVKNKKGHGRDRKSNL